MNASAERPNENELENRLHEQKTACKKSERVSLERQSLLSRERQVQAEAHQLQDVRVELNNHQTQLDTQIREFMAKVQLFQPRLVELEARESAVRAKEEKLNPLADTLAKDRMSHDAQLIERQQQLEAREAKLALDEQAAQQLHAQYQADLMRIGSRSPGARTGVGVRQVDIEGRYEQMQRDTANSMSKLVSRRRQVRVRDEAARLTRQKTEQDAGLACRAAATLEGQQAMLATLEREWSAAKTRQQAQTCCRGANQPGLSRRSAPGGSGQTQRRTDQRVAAGTMNERRSWPQSVAYGSRSFRTQQRPRRKTGVSMRRNTSTRKRRGEQWAVGRTQQLPIPSSD